MPPNLDPPFPAQPTRRPNAWFVGLTTLDVVHRAAAPPQPNTKVTASRQDIAAGGPAANAAVTAAALGCHSVLISALGAGSAAGVSRDDLLAHGVVILDQAESGFELAVSAVLISEASGERTVVSPDAGVTSVPGPTSGQLEALTASSGAPDLVMFDGHHGRMARRVLDWLHAATPDPRPLVLLDCGRWREVFADLLRGADLAALSADFATPNTVNAVAGCLDLGARSVVVTHGGDPVAWSTGSASGSVAVPNVNAMDTLGAGDAFHGALAAALAWSRRLSGESALQEENALQEAVEFAVSVAVERVQHVGPRDWLRYLPSLRPALPGYRSGEPGESTKGLARRT